MVDEYKNKAQVAMSTLADVRKQLDEKELEHDNILQQYQQQKSKMRQIESECDDRISENRRRFEAESQRLKNEISSAREKADEFKTQLEQANKELRRARPKMKDLEGQVQDLMDKNGKLEAEVRQARAAIRRSRIEADDLKDECDSLKRKTKRLQGELDDILAD